jgi:hypothetical protein
MFANLRRTSLLIACGDFLCWNDVFQLSSLSDESVVHRDDSAIDVNPMGIS